MIFSRWLVRPLTGLAQVTSNLPDKLLRTKTSLAGKFGHGDTFAGG